MYGLDYAGMVFKAAINIWAYAKYMYRESQDV